MSDNKIRSVPVWSGWVRFTHGLLVVGVLFQLFSAWTLQQSPLDYEFWRDWHMIVGQLVLLSVVGRLILLFMLPGSSNWRALLPDQAQWLGMKQMLRFYVSFARAPLPNWFAHNPLWRQLYVVLWLLILACAFSGLFYNAPHTLLGLAMHKVHGIFAGAVLWFVVLHVLAVILHDIKGKGAAISGMLNGIRYFHVESPAEHKPAQPKQPSVTHVAIDSITKAPRKP